MNFDNIWCWLIPLLVGAICGLLGYLMGRRGKDETVEVIDNSAELKSLESANAKLKADLNACNQKLTDAEAKVKANLKVKTSKADVSTASSFAAGAVAGAVANDVKFDADAAKAVFGKRIKQDDLKVVEGIGPKIEGLFHNFDIKTWKALSETSVEKCQEVLNSGGERYRIHDPGSWPLQAKMAYEGAWKKLAKWQDEHKGGKL